MPVYILNCDISEHAVRTSYEAMTGKSIERVREYVGLTSIEKSPKLTENYQLKKRELQRYLLA